MSTVVLGFLALAIVAIDPDVAQAPGLSMGLELETIVRERREGCNTQRWSDVKEACGGCKVLANNMSARHRTCKSYCRAQGSTCVAAWDEVSNSCTPTDSKGCDYDFHFTSDAICECSAGSGGSPQQPAPQPAPRPANPGSCSNEEIKFATYNILYKNCNGYHNNCQCKSDRPAKYAASTVRPDVLGTQENGCQKDFGDDMGGSYKVVPMDRCQSCNHNAIYHNTEKVQYAGQRGVEKTVYKDNYSERMYTWARFKTNGGFVFWLFNVHNPHNHGHKLGFQADIAEQMINKYKSIANGEPAVFTGDFNPHVDRDSWEKYAVQHGLTKAGQSSGGICGMCDQIYYTNGDFEVVTKKVFGTGGSDHNAYSVTLRPSCGGGSRNPSPSPSNNSGGCSTSGWTDVKKSCGTCKVLANNMSARHRTCKAYCREQGRSCVDAWEESNNSCDVLDHKNCDSDFNFTSDAICECR